jgi:hypothetical protein
LIRGSRKRAKKDGIEHRITEKDVTYVDTCPILGLSLVLNRGRVGPDSFSLDRKNPTLGYIPGNCFIISWAANQAKDRMSREDVLRLLAYMES